MQQYGGIATIAGHLFGFPTNGGLGLIDLDGKKTLVRFSCPLESLPPRGGGEILGQSFLLSVVNGMLTSSGEPVALGVPLRAGAGE